MSDINMKNQEILNCIEELSVALVFIEPSDLKELADLYTGFEKVGKLAVEISQNKVSEASKKASDIIEKMILNEISDPEAALQVLGRVVSAIQTIIRDRRNANEFAFPEELELDANTRKQEQDSDV